MEITWIVKLAEEKIDFLLSNWPILGVLIFILLWSTYTDATEMKIYNEMNLFSLITRLLLIPFFPLDMWDIIGGLVFFIAFLIVGMMAPNTNIGGDIKFAGTFGLWAGAQLGLLSLGIAILMIIPISLIKRTSVPLAPFVTIGFFVSMILI